MTARVAASVFGYGRQVTKCPCGILNKHPEFLAGGSTSEELNRAQNDINSLNVRHRGALWRKVHI
jgi:hypothetical protein